MRTGWNKRRVSEDPRTANERTVSHEVAALVRDSGFRVTQVYGEQFEEVAELPEEAAEDNNQAVSARTVSLRALAEKPGLKDHLRRVNRGAGAEADEIDLDGY